MKVGDLRKEIYKRRFQDGKSPKHIIIPDDDWDEIYDEVAELVKDIHGLPLCSQEYLEKGYFNILVKGIPIIAKSDAKGLVVNGGCNGKRL